MKGFDLQCQIVTFKTITAMFSRVKLHCPFLKRLFTAICGSEAYVASGIAVMCRGKHLVRTPFQD